MKRCLRKTLTLLFAGLLLSTTIHLVNAQGPEHPIAYSFRLPLEGKWGPFLTQDFANWGEWWEQVKEETLKEWKEKGVLEKLKKEGRLKDGKILKGGYHLGEDIKRDAGTKVYPTADGIVKYAGWAMGYTLVIQHKLPPSDSHGEYVCSVYYHLKMPPPDDKGIKWVVGQEVFKADPIGYLSGKPDDYGPFSHLHFGIRKDKHIPGTDKRTETWYYPGYTVIKKDGVPQCDPKDPVHQLILAEWFDPCDFLSKYLEPSQKFTPGDYVLVSEFQ